MNPEKEFLNVVREFRCHCCRKTPDSFTFSSSDSESAVNTQHRFENESSLVDIVLTVSLPFRGTSEGLCKWLKKDFCPLWSDDI